MARNRKQRQDITAIAYDKRGRIISVGKNSYVKTHPLQASFAKSIGKPDACYLHAEIDALIKARGRTVHRLFVSRVNKHGQYCLARPCPSCQRAIEHFGVKIVEHT